MGLLFSRIQGSITENKLPFHFHMIRPDGIKSMCGHGQFAYGQQRRVPNIVLNLKSAFLN